MSSYNRLFISQSGFSLPLFDTIRANSRPGLRVPLSPSFPLWHHLCGLGYHLCGQGYVSRSSDCAISEEWIRDSYDFDYDCARTLWGKCEYSSNYSLANLCYVLLIPYVSVECFPSALIFFYFFFTFIFILLLLFVTYT